jgi:CRISPR/Cas system CMR-associated protein Cmr1 (group 7 of RAMP superfamily)
LRLPGIGVGEMGFLEVVVSVPRGACCLEERVPLTVQVKNHSDRGFAVVSVVLKQKVTYRVANE